MTSHRQAFVIRDATPVRYLECRDDGHEITAAWTAVEGHFTSLRGLHFLAMFDPGLGWYRACVTRTAVVDELAADLSTGRIPGGRYARSRLRGAEGVEVERIINAFEALRTSINVDPHRPQIEHYRSHTEVDVLVPVL